jgi:hypothetical protein
MSKETLIERLLGKEVQKFESKLKMFSVSDADADSRRRVYSQVLEQTMELDRKVLGRKTFAEGASVSAANLSFDNLTGLQN